MAAAYDPGERGPGERRPGTQAVTWWQLGVLVLDGSISMTWDIDVPDFTGKKFQAVDLAARGLINRLRVSDNAPNFVIAVVKFHEHVTEDFPPCPVLELPRNRTYDPTSAGTGQTFIGSGLARAQEICKDFFAEHQDGDLPTSAVVLLLTDGECGDPERTKAIAEELKQNNRITLATAFLATKGKPSHGVGLLQTICSPPDPQTNKVYYTTVYDPETLRDFWIASMVAPSAGKNPEVP